MFSITILTALLQLSASSQLTTVVLPQRPGTLHGLEWCSKGLSGAAIRSVQTLLSQRMPMTSALNLVALFESHFAPLTGRMILTPTQWVNLHCESDLQGASRMTRAPETFFLFPVALGDLWCRTLKGESLEEADAERLLESQQEMSTATSGALSEVINLVVTGSKPRPGLIMNDQTLLAVLKLLPIVQRLLSFDPGTPLSERLSDFSAKVCRLNDLEQMVPGISETTPVSCTLSDLVMAGSACTPIKYDPQSREELQAECRLFEHHWDNNQVIQDFPENVCYATRSVLQRKDQLRDKTLRAFYWSDPDLHLGLDLNLISPTPDFHDLGTRNSELLTYLALYRANILLYRFSEVAWAACETKPFDKPRNFVPGWDLYHLISVSMPVELDTRVESWRHGNPFVAMSLNSNKPCEMLFMIRGTAFAFEWLLNFNWWSVPMPEINAQVHSGYLAVWQSLVATVQALIEAASASNECTCSQTRLIFTGHSMGASIAQILSTHFANKYKTAGCDARFDAVLFANPRCLSSEALQIYKDNVNGRSLIDIADPVHHLPCHAGNSRKGMPRCSQAHVAYSGKGRDQFPENIGTIMLDIDFYSRGLRFEDAFESISIDNSSEIGIEPSSRTKESSAGISPFMANLLRSALSIVLPSGSMQAIPSKWELVNAHVCSYSCGLSIACHGLPWSDFKWWCGGLKKWAGHRSKIAS